MLGWQRDGLGERQACRSVGGGGRGAQGPGATLAVSLTGSGWSERRVCQRPGFS